jgi:glyoxylase-like metal-dependent hydrolase (beta-lactamase superfamily II)
MPTRVTELGEGRLLADLGFRDSEGLVASFFLPQPDGWSVVETGPASCRAHLLEALGAAGISPSEVRRVLVTHIHLDHAGGMGALVEALPNATFYAHREGGPHLVDPTRLIASARRAWGPAADPLWGPILPVPADRLRLLEGGERLPLSGGVLEVLATPGHARHHLSFLDSATGGLMTGDSAGVRLSGAWHARPAIPPPDLDLEALFASLDRMSERAPRRVLYTHFGESPDGTADLASYRSTVEAWRDAGLAAARTDPSVDAVARALRVTEEEASRRAGRPVGGPDERGEMVSGYELAAQGLLRYFRTRGWIPE